MGNFSTFIAALWWERLPRAAAWLSPTAAAAIADGRYLRAASPAGLLGILAALAVGIAAAWLQFSGTSRLPFVSLLLPAVCAFGVVGVLSAGWGLVALVAYAVADQTLLTMMDNRAIQGFLRSPDALGFLLQVRAPRLIGYALLLALCVGGPLGARALAGLQGNPVRAGAAARQFLRAVGYLVALAFLTFAWTQAFPTLSRPIWVWSSGPPPPEMIQPIQNNPAWIVGAVLAAAFCRLLLDAYADTAVAQAAGPAANPQAPAVRSLGERLPLWMQAAAGVAAGTFLLSGLVQSWGQAALVAGVLLAALVLKWLLGRRETLWLQLMKRIPLLLRVAAAISLAYGASLAVVTQLWRTTETFLPVIAAMAASMLILRVLLPDAWQWQMWRLRAGSSAGRRPDA